MNLKQVQVEDVGESPAATALPADVGESPAATALPAYVRLDVYL